MPVRLNRPRVLGWQLVWPPIFAVILLRTIRSFLLHILRRRHRSGGWLRTGRNRLRLRRRALIVVRRLVRPFLLHVLRRRQRSTGWLHTGRNRLRVLRLVGVVCRRIRVHLRIDWPLNTLHRADWVCARCARGVRRIRRVWSLLLVARGIGN